LEIETIDYRIINDPLKKTKVHLMFCRGKRTNCNTISQLKAKGCCMLFGIGALETNKQKPELEFLKITLCGIGRSR